MLSGFETGQLSRGLKHPAGAAMIDLPFDLEISPTSPLILQGVESAKFVPKWELR